MTDLFDFEIDTVDRLLTAIKIDDKKAFSDLTANSKYLSLCYGKFPILSLLYLYNSNKILSSFERDLIYVKDYIFVEDDIETNIKFKALSHRGMRLFLEKDVISPAVMLAILGEDYKLKTFIKHGYLSETEENIIRAYELASTREAQFIDGKLHVEKPKMKAKEIAVLAISFMLSVIIALLSFGLYTYTKVMPDGSVENPYSIATSKNLVTALNNNDSIVLTKDITLNDTYFESVSSNIDGGGHTLYLSNLNSPFINELQGSIKNLNIVIANVDAYIIQSTSFFVKYNKGTLSNLNVLIKSCLFEIKENEEYTEGNAVERYISPFNCYNLGEISNCNITINGIELKGDHHTDAVYGSICAYNYSLIGSCSVKGDCIVSDTVDLGGIVGINSSNDPYNYATIINCSNYTNVTQSTTAELWSINVGGIAFYNYDTITQSKNYGEVTASATSSNASPIYIGGIAAKNAGLITNSINKGNITASNSSNTIYSGGIAGYSEDSYSEISNCGVSGDLTISVSADTYVFVGGIVSIFEGYFGYNYSSMTYNINATDTYKKIGGLAGGTFVTGSTYYRDNYYLKNTNVTYGLSCYLEYFFGTTYVTDFTQEYYSIPCDNISQIEALEIYIG